MIKINEVAQRLIPLIPKSRTSEQSYRAAMSCMKSGSEKALFIYFWQEHAKMISELEEKVRRLRGVVDEGGHVTPWGGLCFSEEAAVGEIVNALSACEQNDTNLIKEYETILKAMLPVDVRTLLRSHVLKIKEMRERVHALLRNSHPALVSDLRKSANLLSYELAQSVS